MEVICIQSPDHKRQKSGHKSPQESICRRLDSALAAAGEAPQPESISKPDSFDSLDIAMHEVDAIKDADAKRQASTTLKSCEPDPESRYTASQEASDKQDANSTSSPGQGKTS